MNDALSPNDDAGTLSPLPGEPGIPDVASPPKGRWSRKGLLAVALLVLAIVGVAALTVHRWTVNRGDPEAPDSRRVGDRPAVASAEPRRLEMPTPTARAPQATAQSTTSPRIPALVATEEELAEPIGVRRSGDGGRSNAGKRVVSPEDAPAMLVTSRPGAGTRLGAALGSGGSASPGDGGNGGNSADGSSADHQASPGASDPMAATARNLQDYQHQLRGLLDTLTRSTALATGQSADAQPMGSLLGGVARAAEAAGAQLADRALGAATARTTATLLGNRSLTLPKGTAFTCVLKTRVISATSGLVGCQTQRNVYSDDGRVLLIERGSHLDGEYRISSVRPGMVRIPVVWTRIRTPHGVTVDVDSPGTGPLGEAGIDGYVDNRWGERIGAAMLLSLIDDSVKLVVQQQAAQNDGDTIVLPSTTGSTSKLAEKVLDSTINIPPLVYQNQGGVVGIYVARDVDFSSVYELKPTDSERPREGPR